MIGMSNMVNIMREYDDKPYHERHDYYEDSTRFNPKLDISDFEGRMQLDDFLDWLNTVEGC